MWIHLVSPPPLRSPNPRNPAAAARIDLPRIKDEAEIAEVGVEAGMDGEDGDPGPDHVIDPDLEIDPGGGVVLQTLQKAGANSKNES